MTPEWLKHLPLDLIYEVSKHESVDWKLMASLIYQESAGNAYAIRYEPNYSYLYRPDDFYRKQRISLLTEEVSQMFSVGLCQLMFAVMREMGYRGTFSQAFNPKLNITYGAKKIKQLKQRFGSTEYAVSAYNQGGPYMRDGVLKNKTHYVDPIFDRMSQI